MENKLKSGDILFCKYRGRVEVARIVDNGFYVKSNCVEYFQKYEELGKILFREDIFHKRDEGSVNEYIPITYEQCLGNRGLKYNDIILKEETKYLCKTRNVIGREIFDLKNRIVILKNDMGIEHDISIEERDSWLWDRMQVEKKIKQIEELKRVDLEPYFARLDIEGVSNKEVIKAYIGQKSIDEKGENIVFDWRSPLGQRFYRRNELDFNLRGSKYKINLIRRFEIKDSQLYSYENEYNRNNAYTSSSSSENINTISDPFLIRILKSKRNKENIENIISSIQSNQNDIITQELNTNIIVQGCAGSGKTMVLLHRLSYLLYNNNNLELDRFKIITPNKLFKLSINNLAKELELNNIEMFSVEEYLESKIKEYGISIKYECDKEDIPSDMYRYIYSNSFIELLRKSYKKYIDSLWEKLRENQIEELISFYKITIDKRELDGGYTHIRRLIEEADKEVVKRIVKYEETIENEKEIVRDVYAKINKLHRLEQLYKKEKSLSWLDIIGRHNLKKEISDIIEEIDLKIEHKFKVEAIISEISNKIEEYEQVVLEHEINDYNKNMKKFRSENFLNNDPKDLKIRINRLSTLVNKDNNFLNIKICMPLIDKVSELYNYDGGMVNGRIKLFALLNLLYMHQGKLNKVDRMLCFDEGQDINKFEYKLINDINGENIIFNILGDENQLINNAKGTENWDLLSGIKVFKKFKLAENYRNSQEIAKYCINETGYTMNPIGVDDGGVFIANETEKDIDNIIKAFSKDDAIRKVIIVKHVNEDIKRFLQTYFNELHLNIIYDDSNSINTDKINVMTVNMVKGMEFDASLVFTNGMTNNEKYIALTRALVNSYIINKIDIQ